jgi:hypothetical protein
MRRVVVLLAALLLSACYQVEGETTPDTAGVRAEGVRDGLYRRPDGTEVAVRWNPADRLYELVRPGASGKARLRKLAGGLHAVRYEGEMRLALLAAAEGDDIVLYVPTREAERRLAKRFGLTVKPGPIQGLAGSPTALDDYLTEAAALAGSPELVESARLSYTGPLR